MATDKPKKQRRKRDLGMDALVHGFLPTLHHSGSMPVDEARSECVHCGRMSFASTVCSCDDTMAFEHDDIHPIETLGTTLSPNNTGQDAWYRFRADRTTMDDDQQAA